MEKPLWEQKSPKILLFLPSQDNYITHIINNILEVPTFLSNVLTNDGYVGVGLERALQDKMTWIPPHQSNEVPILSSGSSIYHDIPDKLRVKL